MDVEKTIEFILKTQAKTDVRLAGITKLVQHGIQMLARHDANFERLTKAQERLTKSVEDLARAQKRTEVKMGGLSDAQRATERTLKTFISSLGLRNGRNNHKS